MKKIISLVLLIFIFCSCEKNNHSRQVSEIVNEVKEKVCPDEREGIFRVEFYLNDESIKITGETNLKEAKAELYSELTNAGFQIVDSMVVLPDASLDSMNWGLVTISVCNLRADPGHDSEMVSQAILGTPLKVLKKLSYWYLIQTPDKYIGWVDSDAIVRLSESQFKNWRNKNRMVYLPSVGLAFDPETKMIKTDLVAGSILCIEETKGNSSILSMPDGRLIELPSADVVDFDKWCHREISAKEISTTALSFMGRPYLWGGTSTKGIDCSGFVKTVYFLNGYILARDASLQFNHGEKISPEQGWISLQEGDLVFFGKKATEEKPAKATHVGYYLGNGEFIHSSGYVRVNSFNPEKENYSEYRSISWLGGRRVLNYNSNGIVKVADHPWY